MREPVPGNLLRGDSTAVSLIAAAVEGRVAIENFPIHTGRRHAQTIAAAHDGGEVADADERPPVTPSALNTAPHLEPIAAPVLNAEQQHACDAICKCR